MRLPFNTPATRSGWRIYRPVPAVTSVWLRLYYLQLIGARCSEAQSWSKQMTKFYALVAALAVFAPAAYATVWQASQIVA